MRLWNAADGEPLRVLAGHRSPVLCVAFSDDGRTLLSAGTDRLVGVWDLESGRLKRMLKGPAEPVLVGHGRTLALAGGGRVALWEPGSETFQDFPCHKLATGSPLAVSDTLMALSSRNRVELYDLETGKLWKELPAHPPYLGGLPGFATAPADILLPVTALAFSPDARTLAIAVKDGPLTVFQPDQMTVSQPDQIYLWDVQSGKLLRSLKGHEDYIYAIAFDWGCLATGSGGQDKTIKLWNPDTGELVQRLEGHAGIIYNLAFAPDGRTLVSGSGDGTVRLWTDSSHPS